MTAEPLYQGPIVVKKSPIHGYGVFATEDIAEDAVIEECHCLLTTSSSPPEYLDYYFAAGTKSALPLGYGCIYNHADNPNVEWEFDPLKNLFIFKSLRAIQEGEELYSSYGDDWFSTRKLKAKSLPWWRKGITRKFLKVALRFALLYLLYLGYLQGLKFLGR